MASDERPVDAVTGPWGGPEFSAAAVERYRASGEHDEQISARLGELFLAALPFAEPGINLRLARCHDVGGETTCARCRRVARLRLALEMALP